MSYTKNIWKPADIITADKLNNIEQGLANIDASKVIQIPNHWGGAYHILDISKTELLNYFNAGYELFFYLIFPNDWYSGNTPGAVYCPLNSITNNQDNFSAEFIVDWGNNWYYHEDTYYPDKLVIYLD